MSEESQQFFTPTALVFAFSFSILEIYLSWRNMRTPQRLWDPVDLFGAGIVLLVVSCGVFRSRSKRDSILFLPLFSIALISTCKLGVPMSREHFLLFRCASLVLWAAFGLLVTLLIVKNGIRLESKTPEPSTKDDPRNPR
jgi:hypothetical protein